MPTRKYGAETTAAEIVQDVDLHGRRAVVPGASSGIGVETARALASTGAEVTLAVRNVETGKKVAGGIGQIQVPDPRRTRARWQLLGDAVRDLLTRLDVAHRQRHLGAR